METVVFRQVQAARRRNTLRPVRVVIGSLLILSWKAQARNMSCACCDFFFADPKLESPSPEHVYELGTERAGPLTYPRTFLFIDYVCLLCCFSN